MKQQTRSEKDDFDDTTNMQLPRASPTPHSEAPPEEETICPQRRVTLKKTFIYPTAGEGCQS